MTTPEDLEKKLWKAVKSDRTIMLGLERPGAGDAQPMTAIVEDDTRGPIWIFSAKDVDLVQAINGEEAAVAQFASKGHDLFATMHGTLTLQNDPATVERLWNPFIAAWYEGGRSDPKLRLLRLDLHRAHVWLNENSLFAGLKLLMGSDPKKQYADKTADIRL
ncbi:MAG: pyridoxamine 5'-phosphate oxidase family protein [Acidobacteria bacterium]|nr:pyridoxamine 5'-phosphate oxidase family protein [Acidobacteriota bacterium]